MVASATKPASRSPEHRAFSAFAPPGLMDLYVTREMAAPFLVTLVAALVIFLGNELFWSMLQVLYLNVNAGAVARWLLLSIPKFSVLAIPVATVFAVSMGTHRMARENELTAWRMAGASVLRLMAPFFSFAMLLSALVYALNEHVVPWATHEREVIMAQEIRRSDPVRWIENDTVFKAGDGYIFYVRQVNHHDNTLREIIAYHPHPALQTTLEVIVAESGRLEKRQWTLKNCVFHRYDSRTGKRVDRPGANVEMKLGEFIVPLKQGPEMQFIPQKSNAWEMTSTELRQMIRDQETLGLKTQQLQEFRVERHHKFSLALGALAAALVAAPLALRFARSGSFAGFMIAVILVFFYQGFESWFIIMGYKAWLPPVVAAWATNALYGAAGLGLLARQR